jgi:hypothetical protein
VAEFSNNFKREDRDLALAPPRLYYKPAADLNDDAAPQALTDDYYTRVMLPASVIKSIWISYQPRSPEQAHNGGKRTALQRLPVARAM